MVKVLPRFLVCVWILAHEKVISSDLIQRRRSTCLSLPSLVYYVQRRSRECESFVLHCPISLPLGNRVFRECNLSWVTPADCVILLGERFGSFGRKKTGLVLVRCYNGVVLVHLYGEEQKNR